MSTEYPRHVQAAISLVGLARLEQMARSYREAPHELDEFKEVTDIPPTSDARQWMRQAVRWMAEQTAPEVGMRRIEMSQEVRDGIARSLRLGTAAADRRIP